MKREELEILKLTKEQIQGVFKLNGIDIEKAKGDSKTLKSTLKTKNTEIVNLKSLLNKANKTIQLYEGMDIPAIRQSANDYKLKFENADKKAKEQIDELKFEYSLESALNKAGARNVKAVKALLDMENLRVSKKVDTDIKTQITILKESVPYLFAEEKDKTPNITDQTMEVTKRLCLVKDILTLVNKEDY